MRMKSFTRQRNSCLILISKSNWNITIISMTIQLLDCDLFLTPLLQHSFSLKCCVSSIYRLCGHPKCQRKVLGESANHKKTINRSWWWLTWSRTRHCIAGRSRRSSGEAGRDRSEAWPWSSKAGSLRNKMGWALTRWAGWSALPQSGRWPRNASSYLRSSGKCYGEINK